MYDASVDDSCLMKAFKGVPKANPPPIVEVPPWHVIVVKLHELLTQPHVNRTSALPNVVVVHNENGIF
jgi:hypothetical protein